MDQEEGTSTKEASPTNSRKRLGKKAIALVEIEVRRSPKLKDSAKGFKISGCTNKKCLACGTTPPIPKKESIKKIASEFCDLDENELTDELLQMKKHKTHPVARARIILEGPSYQPTQPKQDPEEGSESQGSGGWA